MIFNIINLNGQFRVFKFEKQFIYFGFNFEYNYNRIVDKCDHTLGSDSVMKMSQQFLVASHILLVCF